MKKTILKHFLILSLLAFAPAFAQGEEASVEKNIVPVSNSADNSGVFSLTTIMDNFLNLEFNKGDVGGTIEEKQRAAFVSATKKFNQGNVAVAKSEYKTLLKSIKSDYALLVFAKSMYEIGLFSIGNDALNSINHKDYLKEQIENLKVSFLPSILPTQEEEIYFAKAYSAIYFDNSAQETAYELNKNDEIKKSDWANYLMAQAFSQMRQWQPALNYINKALSINKNNISYMNFKIKTLNNLKKHKEALSLIEKMEKSKEINFVFKNSYLTEAQVALAGTSKENEDKKFHLAMKTFLEGNYQKTIKDCENILSFDKNNYRVISLLALSQLVLGDIENAQKNYLQSYSINKNYPQTLIGLGDVEFLNGNFKNATKYYKEAFSKNQNDQTTALKLALIYQNDAKKGKDLKKIEKKLEKMNPEPYLSYHSIAATVTKNNQNLRRDYIRRASVINPLYENGWVALLNFELENKRYDAAKNFLYMISFSNRTNYVYFYLNAIFDVALGKKNEAIVNLKNCLSLNPDFEEATRLLLEILPSKIEDFQVSAPKETKTVPVFNLVPLENGQIVPDKPTFNQEDQDAL